jgi:hypothetical protein
MKNQKSTILALGFVFLGMMACDTAKTTEQTAIMESPAPAPASSEASDLPPLSSIPESTPPISATIPPPTALNPAGALATSSVPLAANAPLASSVPVNTAKAVSTARLNPAHGQPGHDCSIAVGAPLKSTAAAAKPAPASAQPVATSTPTFETKSVAAPAVSSVPNLNPNAKINPAHGQPGHDCAVAVGAPLPVK